jgi:hypothetical protein
MDVRQMEQLNPEGFARRRRAAHLEEQIATLANHMHAANYRLIAMLRMFDELGGWEGWTSPAHWLCWRCGYSLGAAREKFRVARALPELPLIRSAFKKGELSFAQVRAMTRIATPDNEATQHRERSFTCLEEDSGMVSFRICLPAEQAAVVLKAIEAAKAALDGQDLDDVAAETRVAMINEPPDHPDEDVSAETRRARMADAFMRVAEAYLEPDARPRSIAEKYQVHVHMDLRRDADGPVRDPDAPALAEETLRRLGCEAGLVPVLHDGGEILSVGRKTRAVPPSIRRALRLRDRGCRFPGCTHHRHVDAHHVQHWADGGETRLSNLVELCGRHHRLLHEGGYGLRCADDGALLFTRPNGERIPDVPRPLVLTGNPIAALEHANRRLGVSAETHRSRWDGAAADYGTAIDVLDDYARKRRSRQGSVPDGAGLDSGQ